MQTEKTKAIVSWILTAVCMCVIFWISSRDANESSQQSKWLLQLLTKVFGDNLLTDFIVRKAAHFLEFAGLCFLFNISLRLTKNKNMVLPAIIFTSLYSITDELHQIFVQGRACRFTDWVIDTTGAVFGAFIFIVIYKIVSLIRNKSKKTH